MRTLDGPDGLQLVLDEAQIFPHDPGQGTPAMVHWMTSDATYWWAINEGTLYGPKGDLPLTRRQLGWLAEQEQTVHDFLNECRT